MRIWVAITSVILLVFCGPGLFWALISADWQSVVVCTLFVALAVHGLYYINICKTQPARGYFHLAVGQFLIGALAGALLLQLAYKLESPQFWDTFYKHATLAMQAQPWLNSAQIDQAQWDELLQESIRQLRAVATIVPLIGAVLSVLSQGAFAWFLYLRSQKASTRADADTPGGNTAEKQTTIATDGKTAAAPPLSDSGARTSAPTANDTTNPPLFTNPPPSSTTPPPSNPPSSISPPSSTNPPPSTPAPPPPG